MFRSALAASKSLRAVYACYEIRTIMLGRVSNRPIYQQNFFVMPSNAWYLAEKFFCPLIYNITAICLELRDCGEVRNHTRRCYTPKNDQVDAILIWTGLNNVVLPTLFRVVANIKQYCYTWFIFNIIDQFNSVGDILKLFNPVQPWVQSF